MPGRRRPRSGNVGRRWRCRSRRPRLGDLRRFAHDYDDDVAATVTSTAGDATLTVSDPSSNATGHLVNGTFALAHPVQAQATNAAHPIGVRAGQQRHPLTLLTYSGPMSNDPVTIGLKQSIGATEALRTGAYTKTLTFTLSTTTP